MIYLRMLKATLSSSMALVKMLVHLYRVVHRIVYKYHSVVLPIGLDDASSICRDGSRIIDEVTFYFQLCSENVMKRVYNKSRLYIRLWMWKRFSCHLSWITVLREQERQIMLIAMFYSLLYGIVLAITCSQN